MFITSVLTLLGLNYLFVCLCIEALVHIFINVYIQCYFPLNYLFICLYIEPHEHLFINAYSLCYNPLIAKLFIYLFVY